MIGTWKINVTPAERIARVLVRLGRAVTGTTGHCPPYQKLGRIPGIWYRRSVVDRTGIVKEYQSQEPNSSSLGRAHRRKGIRRSLLPLRITRA